MSTTSLDIMITVMNTRRYQQERWGNDHDNSHTLAEWRSLIDHYAKQGKWTDVAALGIAAAEAWERNEDAS